MDQAVVLDTNDKATSLKEKISPQSIEEATIRSMHSIIGELSNIATRVWNRVPRNDKERKTQKDYVDLLSVIVGKSIDYSKYGILWLPPKKIAKSHQLTPYFMKYISPYYASMKKFSHAPSNMNLLAKDIEKWQRTLHYRKTEEEPFNHSIMIDTSIQWDTDTYLKVISNRIQRT